MKFFNIFRLLRTVPMPSGMRLRLRRIFLDRAFEKERRQVLKSGGSVNEFWQDSGWAFEYQMLEEDETRFHSQQLLERARRLRIPIPPLHSADGISEDYRESELEGHRYFLSLTGEQKLRAAIREEERYRSDRWARRVPYLTALSGLIGTITGLFALLARWRS